MAVSGVGSSIDVNSLVSQLVTAERAPGDQRFARITSSTQTQITAFGALRSGLNGLDSSLKKFDGVGSSLGRKVTIGADAGFTASAGTTAALGSHQISVERLATAHSLQSAPVDAATQVGYGTLSIQVGSGTAIDIDVAQDHGTLADIRDAINAKASGKGFSATIVHGDSGDVLTLSATGVGTAGKLTVTTTGGDGGLGVLQTTGGTLTEKVQALDAQVKIDGITRTASGNTLSDALDGVTLTLTKADPGKEFSLAVQPDASVLKAGLLSFVSAYNTALSALRTQSAAGGEGKTAGPLSGDAAPRSITASLRGAITSSYAELSTLGFKTAVDGSLSLDGTKFDAAIAADPDAVTKLLGTDGVLGKNLRTQMTSYVGTDGLITGRSNSLNSRMKQIAKQKESFQTHIDSVEATYRKQFSALDALMTQMQSTSSYLSQQFASLSS